MNSNSPAAPRYALSFTTGGLLEREAAVLAPVYVEHRDWVKVRDLAVDENLLQARTYRTGVRLVRETVKRLSALSDLEVVFLDEVNASERGHLMWAAACRRYDLIGEFAEEVLRERFLILANTVAYEDYDSFYRAKAMWHDELDDVTDLSYKKLREVLFKMMVEAGLLTTQRAIEPALLSARVAECLNERSPSDIRFFPTRVA
ncbi:DUF1819 domain-containing protein [Rathayibacter sp. AY1E8]|uniref:DUF1819 family protein n=1 Tax=unclassified Rathayibacter TaxID=2609250 RepID=UPI000CE88F56|nr:MULTISPECIES: DUF1819 family protein [unclassified Rathayibacter]PPG23464.1 DUF1819 domain-containing protein [Rathayibacter sp. AY1E8]PPI02788.1 DUF1819 domain-containing protein [Rathayibacter sp. AY1B7]